MQNPSVLPAKSCLLEFPDGQHKSPVCRGPGAIQTLYRQALPAGKPPLSSSFPALGTPLQGLDEALEELVDLLREPIAPIQLVTVTGALGIGRLFFHFRKWQTLRLSGDKMIDVWLVQQQYPSLNWIDKAYFAYNRTGNFLMQEDRLSMLH